LGYSSNQFFPITLFPQSPFFPITNPPFFLTNHPFFFTSTLANYPISTLSLPHDFTHRSLWRSGT
jgi:hypothetical protein